VVKLFPPDERAHQAAESAALDRIDGSLCIPTPRLIASGDRGNWCFVVMTRLHGRRLDEVWPSLRPEERRRLARGVGAALAELHALDPDGLELFPGDWPRFMRMQRDSCRERQAARGLGAPWIDRIDEFLARRFPADDGRRALLHTEVMREHLLVDDRDGGWRLSGLFDFEPAMVGAPEYEFASVGVFLGCAEPGILGAVLDGYGMTRDEDLPPRLMAYLLLHRYSCLRWYLERLPAPAGATALESLARSWFMA